MKKVLLALAFAGMSCMSFAQTLQKEEPKDDGIKFTTVKEIPITPIKDQHRSSTCWAFSSMGFFEAEILREKGITIDLSEMYLVSWAMRERADLFVRLHGNATFAPGGAFADAIDLLRHHGIVPQEAMPGIKYGQSEGDTLPVHKELDALSRAFLNAITSNNLSRLTPSWKVAFKGIYDAYLGDCPEKFTYEGKEYTPMSFRDYLGLNPDDYISLTSFTHHPFYEQFAIEIEDNWRHSMSYNLPLNELMEVIYNAINNNYTVAWGADVSEPGFSRQGIATVPDEQKTAKEMGSDMARWLGMNVLEKKAMMSDGSMPELDITQELRQQGFENWETTDDHGMLIYGLAKDSKDKQYFIVKNSWGLAGKYKGIWYVSDAYVQYKTINIVVNKRAVPKAILKKLGIK